jgi:hypothetical protein
MIGAAASKAEEERKAEEGGRTEGVGAVSGLDVGEDAEGDEHGDDHGGVAHPARLLPDPMLLHHRHGPPVRWIWSGESLQARRWQWQLAGRGSSSRGY